MVGCLRDGADTFCAWVLSTHIAQVTGDLRDSEQTVRELGGLLQAARGEAQVMWLCFVCLALHTIRSHKHPSLDIDISPLFIQALRGELVAARADREDVEEHVSVLEEALAAAEVGGQITCRILDRCGS